MNVKSKDFETKFYMIIMILVSSLLAIGIYSFASSMFSEDSMNSTTGFNVVRPRLTEEIKASSPAPSPKPSIKQ